MRRGVAVFAVLALVTTSALMPAVAAAQTTETNTTAQTTEETATPRPASDWSPPGPFERDDLTTGGVHDAESPDSVRALGDPVRGSLGIQTQPLLQDKYDWAETGELLESDRITLYGTAYEDAVGEYELVVVYWQDSTKRVNDTTVQYASDQSIQRVSFNMSSGYNRIPVELRSHYDTVQATMWLERDGERVDGARWQYQHRSNPLSAAPGTAVNSKGDLWQWGAVYLMLPGMLGVFVAAKAATHCLDRTITSPRKGTAWWLLTLGFLSMIAVAGATWQTSMVLSQAPFVAGLSIAVVAFVAILRIRDQDIEKAELNQKDLETVTSVSDTASKDSRSEKIRLKDIVRRDGRIFMPASGIRPFLARYWADPASIDESELKTVNNTEGDVSKKYEIDPAADEMMTYKPARLAFSPTIVNPRDEDEPPAESVGEHVMSALSRLNWSFLGPAVVGGGIAYLAMQSWLGVPSISAMVGLLPTLIAGWEARDGQLSFEAAPYHFSEARAVLAHERATHREASTFEDLYEMVADLDFDMLDKGTEIAEVIEARFQERLNDDWEPERLPGDDSVDTTEVADD